jgi:hypothetical protein
MYRIHCNSSIYEIVTLKFKFFSAQAEVLVPLFYMFILSESECDEKLKNITQFRE